jgi:hypothetical protein
LIESDDKGHIYTILSDGRGISSWKSDEFKLDEKAYVSIIIDGGPKIISYVINERFCDGTGWRRSGWGRFNPNLRHANGNGEIRISDKIDFLKIYKRPIMTNEACANHRFYKGRDGI